MAVGKIITPHSTYFGNGQCYSDLFLGAASNEAPGDLGVGLPNATTLSANSIASMRFYLPNGELPTGTAKLRILSLAAANTGNVVFNPSWASVAAGEDPSAITLNAEGNTTIAWAAAEANTYKETKVTLDADTLVAGEIVAMSVKFMDSGTTLAVSSVHQFSIIWE